MREAIFVLIIGALMVLWGSGTGNDKVNVEVHGDLSLVVPGCKIEIREGKQWPSI